MFSMSFLFSSLKEFRNKILNRHENITSVRSQESLVQLILRVTFPRVLYSKRKRNPYEIIL